MFRFLLTILLALTLAGCSYLHPYRPDIQQGNIITPTMVKQLRTGMSTRQVTRIMGDPVLQSTFSRNRMVYVYTLQPNHGKEIEKQVRLTFSRGRLSSIKR